MLILESKVDSPHLDLSDSASMPIFSLEASDKTGILDPAEICLPKVLRLEVCLSTYSLHGIFIRPRMIYSFCNFLDLRWKKSPVRGSSSLMEQEGYVGLVEHPSSFLNS